MGYSYYDFDADVDTQILASWSSTSPSFWDNWVNFGLGAAFSGGPDEASRSAPPIQILTADDLKGTNAEIANRLLINSADVNNIKQEFETSNKNDELVVLFRFATSDYYSEAAQIYIPGGGFLGSNKLVTGQAYIAQESVFLDFDIIQLTFNKDGDYTVIPVVSNPIDIINDITPPANMPDETNWLMIILIVILAIFLIVILWPILPKIILDIFWLICLPFRLIIWFLKLIFKPKDKDKEE
jgi:hypothetical protein